MKDSKNVSGLASHHLNKKRGILTTPLNDAMGEKLKFSSWARERMPEYLWLGLILRHYGRRIGFERAGNILFEIVKSGVSLTVPRLSMIFDLDVEEQRKIYSIICRHVDKEVLAPLTLLYRSRFYPAFNDYFFISDFPIEERLSILSEAIRVYSPHQSHEATDLKFLSLSLWLFSGKLVVTTDASATATALKEYPYTDHDDERMRLYRPLVRSMEGGAHIEEYDTQFSSKFWRDIGMITSCNPIKIEFPENTENYKDFQTDSRKILEYVLHANKEKALNDDKFSVVIGSITYALKIFNETIDKELGQSILGRHAVRSILEVYIMLKYLLQREEERPGIWRDYKLYGVSKYKLTVLKAREYDFSYAGSHFLTPVIDALVNEFMFEEFIDVDLKYFDRQGIRDKSEGVGEKKLYDIFYEYDSNFLHGLWGAVRESAMLPCDSPSHQYHTVPDIYDNQKLADVKSDSFEIMKKLFVLLAELYEMPTWFGEKYNLKK